MCRCCVCVNSDSPVCSDFLPSLQQSIKLWRDRCPGSCGFSCGTQPRFIRRVAASQWVQTCHLLPIQVATKTLLPLYHCSYAVQHRKPMQSNAFPQIWMDSVAMTLAGQPTLCGLSAMTPNLRNSLLPAVRPHPKPLSSLLSRINALIDPELNMATLLDFSPEASAAVCHVYQI